MNTRKLQPKDAAAFRHTICQAKSKQHQLLRQIAQVETADDDEMDEDIRELSAEIENLRKRLIDLALDMKNAGLKTSRSIKHLSRTGRQ
jgi:predicted  nucleic acid-binding Zn-ribbon protein